MNNRSRLKQLQELGWGEQEIAELLVELKKTMYRAKSEEIIQTRNDLDGRILKLVNEIGISYNLLGRDYIIEGLKFAMFHDKFSMSKELYPYLADIFDSEPRRIERSVRHAIKTAFDKKSDLLLEIFSYDVNSVASNKEFFYGLVSYLKRTEQ